MNQTRKTLETDKLEARDLESEGLKFVQFEVQFVRKIRKIRLQISGVVGIHPNHHLLAGHFNGIGNGPRRSPSPSFHK